MKGLDLTPIQLDAAEKYILMRRSAQNKQAPAPNQDVSINWQCLVMLVAEYAAIRVQSVELGGSVNEPGEVYLTGK